MKQTIHGTKEQPSLSSIQSLPHGNGNTVTYLLIIQKPLETQLFIYNNLVSVWNLLNCQCWKLVILSVTAHYYYKGSTYGNGNSLKTRATGVQNKHTGITIKISSIFGSRSWWQDAEATAILESQVRIYIFHIAGKRYREKHAKILFWKQVILIILV